MGEGEKGGRLTKLSFSGLLTNAIFLKVPNPSSSRVFCI